MFGIKRNGKHQGKVRRFVHASWVQWCINSCVRSGVKCSFRKSEVSGVRYVESPLIEISED